MTYTQVNVLEEFGTGALSPGSGEEWPAGWGEVSVVEKVVGYLRANMIAPNPTAIVKLTAG